MVLCGWSLDFDGKPSILFFRVINHNFARESDDVGAIISTELGIVDVYSLVGEAGVHGGLLVLILKSSAHVVMVFDLFDGNAFGLVDFEAPKDEVF